jgi:hypothetical protein
MACPYPYRAVRFRLTAKGVDSTDTLLIIVYRAVRFWSERRRKRRTFASSFGGNKSAGLRAAMCEHGSRRWLSLPMTNMTQIEGASRDKN